MMTSGWRQIRAGLAMMIGLAVAAPCWGQFGGFEPAKAADDGEKMPTAATDVTTVTLYSDVARITPGKTFHLVLRFEMKDHWHVYWKNPGAAGMPTMIEVTAPAGFEVGPPRYPRPTPLEETSGEVFAYEGEMMVFIPVTAPKILADEGTQQFAVSAAYLVCRKACMFGEFTGALALSGGEDSPDAMGSREIQSIVRDSFSRLPRDLVKDARGVARMHGDTLVIEVPAAGHGSGRLYPVPMPGVTFGPEKISIVDNTLKIEITVDIEPGNAMDEAIFIEGMVALGNRPGDPAYEFSLPAPSE